jgi:hypothetical protein
MHFTQLNYKGEDHLTIVIQINILNNKTLNKFEKKLKLKYRYIHNLVDYYCLHFI